MGEKMEIPSSVSRASGARRPVDGHLHANATARVGTGGRSDEPHLEQEVRPAFGKANCCSASTDLRLSDGRQLVHAARTPQPERFPATPVLPDEKSRLYGRILLVEDQPENQQLLALLLSKAGAGVSAVANGRLAVEAALAAVAADSPFDVILMDMQMPVMDGYEATRQLREHDYGGFIVALTAHAMAGDREKCLAAGCNGYLVKPCQYRELLTVVAKYLHAGPDDQPRALRRA
jgi:CheY-like chemotaxis protein